MLRAYVCRCANSQPRMRTFLREAGYKGWQTVLMTKGKSECLAALDALPENQELDKLKLYIKRASSWCVLLGSDGDVFQWADLGHSKLKEKLDAEIIVRDFGNV